MKDTKYGNFSPDGKEFILKNPRLARPWMNVISNGNWAYVASQLGGGYSFLINPTVGRITRWHVDGVPRDSVGKFVYLRDEETGNWWNANGYPPTKKYDDWTCHIGLGYNRIKMQNNGIASEILYFCPMPDADSFGGDDVGDPCMIWRVKLTNNSNKKRIISATNYVELALGNWFEDTSWREFYLLFNRQEYKDQVLYTRSTQWVKYIGGWQAANADANNIWFDYAVFLASTAKVTGYEGDRYEFVGDYRDLSDPQAMDSGKLRNHTAVGRDACESLQHRFELEAGDSAEYVLVLGAVPKEAEDASSLTSKYLDLKKADEAFVNNQTYWNRVIERPYIETPDKDLNLICNYWFKYQAANLAWWNRNTGYCYSGIYNFGVRDGCQDAAGRLPEEPQWVRDHIVKRIMIWQFEEGDYAHGGNFLNMQGARTFHSDDPINPIFIVSKYVRETGDYSILEEVTPYAHTNGEKADTIYNHLVKGIDFFFRNFSDRGLPLIMKADWNDAMDQMGNDRKGESVMLAFWAIYCIKEFYTCMEYMKDEARLKEYKDRLQKLADTLNDVAWDGQWYQRATHDSGWILGTKDNTYGKIWANPNSFAIVSGVTSEQRKKTIFKSFEKYLDHELGSYAFYPPFGEPDSRVGIISRFAPATKENGSFFTHTSRWRIWAECFGGRGDKAYEVLHKMMPTTYHENDPDTYRIEPYVACQYIYGPESDNPGEGSHSWATGSAAWTLVMVWEWIFGVRPEVEGLRIDPCMPSDWTQAKLIRKYRGAVYHMTFEKPKGICKGKVKIILDSEALSDNIIEPQPEGKEYKVEVFIQK